MTRLFTGLLTALACLALASCDEAPAPEVRATPEPVIATSGNSNASKKQNSCRSGVGRSHCCS